MTQKLKMAKQTDRIPLASMEELNLDGSPLPLRSGSDKVNMDAKSEQVQYSQLEHAESDSPLKNTALKSYPLIRSDSGSIIVDRSSDDTVKVQDFSLSYPGAERENIIISTTAGSQFLEELPSDSNATFPNIPAQTRKPPDRLNLVFLIFILHGIGTLMPWNMFITAKSYFVDFKLKVNDSASTEEYREHFLPYLGVASQVPNVICNALNIFVQFSGGSLTFRIIGSILVEIVIFIMTVFLAMVDSSTWAGIFFYITMASVVVLNMANGIYQNSIYGLAAKLPMKYSMAIVLGSNTSGTFASLILILSIAASPNQRTAAIYYFITALFVLLACVDTYFALPLIRFYRYHERLSQKAVSENVPGRPPYWKIFCKTWPQCLNVFLVFFVTLTIFPAIHADIKRIDENFPIPEIYFTPVTCYLCFNFFAMMGSLVPNWIKWPGPRFLWMPVVLRITLIPLFMLCNYKPDKRLLPVFIYNDWAYFALAVVLGFTSGYYSSLAMMYAPSSVDKEHSSIAAMMAAFFLVLGIVCGVNFTFFVSWIIETKLF